MSGKTTDPATIVEAFLAVCAAAPERPFCVHYVRGHGETISYGALRQRAGLAAGALAARGCGRGDVVLLFVQHQAELYPLFLGCLFVGAIPSFMPYPNPKQDEALFWRSHLALLARIAPKLVVVSAALAGAWAANLPDQAGLLLRAEDAVGPDLAPVAARPGDVALLQHSSGTTGLKKGVMLSHQQVLDQIAAYGAATGFGAGDIVASWLPLYHDMGLIACFIQTLVQGASLVALDPIEWVNRPSLLLEAIERHQATCCWLPNFAFNHLALTARAGQSFDLSSMRAFVNCSEPCKPASFELFLRRFQRCGADAAQLQVCYGMAENVFAVTSTRAGIPASVLECDRTAFETEGKVATGTGLRLLSCGVPVAGVALRIADHQGTAQPERQTGEIWIKSPFLFAGYYREPELSARVLPDGWYRSGDLGFIAEGELFVTGRTDDLLIAYGRNYYAHDIEQIASQVEGVVPGRSVAFALTHDSLGTSQIMLLAETRDAEADAALLARRLWQAVMNGCGLALHKVELVPHGFLVKTSSGKISRDANRQRYLDARNART